MTSQIKEIEQPDVDDLASNEGMAVIPLKERVVEVMSAMGWTPKEFMRKAKISPSVMSQWKSGEILSIGKVDTALRLQQETGFAAIWLAVGTGPKMANTSELASDSFHVKQITELARKLPADKLLKLHEMASKLSFPDPQPTGVPETVAESRIKPAAKKTAKKPSA